MSNVSELIRSANPVPEMNPLSDDEVNAVLTLTMTRSGEMDVKENMTPVEPDRKRNGWLVAAAAFGAVIIVAGLAIALVATGNSGDDIAPAGVDDNPAVTTQPPTTSVTPTTEASAAAQATTTTTQPATTTTTLPFIRTGTYSVPDEVAPGTYRHRSAVARLDENMELIENYLVADSQTRNPMTGIVIVQPTDSFITVEAWIILVEDFGGPNDPIAKGLFNGVYLVGYDIEPGRYEVHPRDGGEPSWARLDDEMKIIDSETGIGTLEVLVEAGDFAFEFLGDLRRIP